jgi:tRNA-modifying protein YgfZ
VGPHPSPPAGVREGTLDDLEHARVVAGWPAMGTEITESTIPAETGLTGMAVSFTKGCYPGQELVERMDSRGATAPRLLRRLLLPAGATVDRGAPVWLHGKEVGRVTSAAGDCGLALVGRAVEVPVAAAVRHETHDVPVRITAIE